jgi:pyruvate,orthophosphate dikinase
MRKFVYSFSEGNKDLKELLVDKGANLVEMTNMGLPLPPGFTITSQAYLASGQEPPELAAEVAEHLASLEATMG